MKQFYFYTLVTLVIILACVLPSQATQLAPTLDPHLIETAIANTMQAATAMQSTATATPGGMTGIAIELAKDGSTKYKDYDGSFEITFPAGWLVVQPNSEEFNTVLTKNGAKNSMLHDQMVYDQAGYDAKLDRVYSYILRPDIQKNVIFGFSKLAFDLDDTIRIDSVTMGQFVRDLEASGSTPGFRADTAQVREYTNIKMIEVGGHWMKSDGKGGTIPFYATVIFFKPSANSIVRLTFSFLEDYHEDVGADIRFILKSIKTLDL
jgi:hypothetical protein